jgi:hypothetical protein
MVCGATALTFAIPALASEPTNHERSGALVSGATSLVSETPRLDDAVEVDEEGNDDATDETPDARERDPRHRFDQFDQVGKAGRKPHDTGNADQDRQEHGPPAWAHAHNHKSHASPATWKALTPARRRSRMAALARQHAAGMRRWGECTSAGREDCVRPVPPGLAKRG